MGTVSDLNSYPIRKQVCIPVGCVPSACCPYLPACTAQGEGVSAPGDGDICSRGAGDVCALGGCLLGGCLCSGGVYYSMH